jgi:glucosamine 6-phosphate synthetase-like amidotransferase/phosphosugar isomerase protein
MCAIFGFVSRGVSRPDIRTLGRIIAGNIGRGPHAYGLAWIDRRGRLFSYRQHGKLTDELGILSWVKDARLLIGHMRFATHGDPAENINNHPHPCDGGWVVHNGVVSNYEQLLAMHDLYPTSQCDSEAIALLIERSDEAGLVRRCIDAARRTRGPLATIGLWKPGRLVAVRRGNPLHLSDNPDGTYIATLAAGLPGEVREVRDNSAVSITLEGGKRHARVQTFATQRQDKLPRHRGRDGDSEGESLFYGR